MESTSAIMILTITSVMAAVGVQFRVCFEALEESLDA
jgi:hypothetical protein